MTKDRYFEMCEMLGTEPVESEIPVEYDDLPDLAQQAIIIYKTLKDDWDGMNGVYKGKIFTGIGDIFDIYEIPLEERKLTYLAMLHIDAIRVEDHRQKSKAKK